MFWDKHTIKRFDVAGPRYTSYPTAMQFHEEFSQADLLKAIERSNEKRRPLSLYFHIPFCRQLCYYCACNKQVTNNSELSREYLDFLKKEVELKSKLFDSDRPVRQLHLGGGTPSFLSDAELTELVHHVSQYFHLLSNDRGDYSIELDPRDAALERLALLRGLGFNRVSLGIQDFDPLVQEVINRVQSYELVKEVCDGVRSLDFDSLSMDLIYGLPYQNARSFGDTIDKVLDLSPDRISLFNYAHLPERFKAQRMFQEESLPSADEKLSIFNESSVKLLEAGYVFIGMDHFAKPGDSLVEAQQKGELHRNFQGYTICPEAELIGFGVSAISHIDNVYSQNVKQLSEYQKRLSQDIPVQERGVELEPEDTLRAWVIKRILCEGGLMFRDFFSRFQLSFQECFSRELMDLQQAQRDGLIQIDDQGFRASEKGRLVLRRLCMFFDEYNRAAAFGSSKHFSRIL